MNDNRMESIIGNLLRGGVLLTATVVAAGGIWYLATSPSGVVDFQQFHPGPGNVRSLGSLPHPQALIMLGLLILIATPVARVAFSLVAFALERDRLYMLLTTLVLAALLYSIATAWW